MASRHVLVGLLWAKPKGPGPVLTPKEKITGGNLAKTDKQMNMFLSTQWKSELSILAIVVCSHPGPLLSRSRCWDLHLQTCSAPCAGDALPLLIFPAVT